MTGVESEDVSASEAIGMSIRQNRIVTIVDPTGSQTAYLDEVAKDCVRNGEEVEFWGTLDQAAGPLPGMPALRGEWRVHVMSHR